MSEAPTQMGDIIPFPNSFAMTLTVRGNSVDFDFAPDANKAVLRHALQHAWNILADERGE